MLDLRIITADDWPRFRDLRLEALREAPYAFSTKLEDWQGEGDTEVRWRDRLTNVPFNVVAELDGMPAGMVSGTFPTADGTVELISMWVAPFARGRNVGDALVGAVILWAAEQHASRVILAVLDNNRHAVNLYRRHRFVDAGEIHMSPDASPRHLMTYEFNRQTL